MGDLFVDEFEAFAALGDDRVGVEHEALHGETGEVEWTAAVLVAAGLLRLSLGGSLVVVLGLVLVGGARFGELFCGRHVRIVRQQLLEGELELVGGDMLGFVRPRSLLLGLIAGEVGGLQLDEVRRLAQLGAQRFELRLERARPVLFGRELRAQLFAAVAWPMTRAHAARIDQP